ncbi:hypothetical protein K437DRAFT_254445 [Tilletiaria anomala UBC 951]|uniref:Transport protein particle component n=1 Tax=Tilletiaria anomala (strain ATCC 24038 / CBS 436.72 / UBC 951) TaxID=1037660 RepID=A0A066WNR6_TILAU|nr:uncharacterized protein K437DRAFT_254445 [Tilletiaria anomala UBC 951]KDN52255.1 hypothetical protein K437DRAFT_254445 [Tilletiaria anomala UBC 951]
MAAKTSAPKAIASSSIPGGSIISPSHSLPPAVSSSSSSATVSNTNANAAASSSQLVTPFARDLSLPPTRQVDAAALDYMTTEMTFTLQESARFAAKKLLKHREELREAGFPVQLGSSAGIAGSAVAANATSAIGGVAGSSPKAAGRTTIDNQSPAAVVDRRSVSQAGAWDGSGGTARRFSSLSLAGPSSEEVDAELTARLEVIGYHVGANMAERLSSLRPPLGTVLDVLKFVCKDVWTAVWDKQVDNLRTNHRGVYVLQDNNFKPLRRMSTARGLQETAREAKPHLSYATGIVCGALARMGVTSTVTVDILLLAAGATQAPGLHAHATACTFSVKTATGR